MKETTHCKQELIVAKFGKWAVNWTCREIFGLSKNYSENILFYKILRNSLSSLLFLWVFATVGRITLSSAYNKYLNFIKSTKTLLVVFQFCCLL